MKIEAGKKYRTRDGQTAHILTVDAPGEKPVIGYVIDSEGYTNPWIWSAGGGFLGVGKSGLDLIAELREKEVGWINLYRVKVDDWEDTIADIFNSKYDADQLARHGRIACVRVEYEEGEGL